MIDVATEIANATSRRILPEVTGKHRAGDIRHCFADISQARRVLRYRPSVDFADGMTELASFLKGHVALDRALTARRELDARGLTL